MAFFSSKISSTCKKLYNIIDDKKKKMQDILKQCTCQVNVAILIFKCKSKLQTQTASLNNNFHKKLKMNVVAYIFCVVFGFAVRL